MRGHSQRDVVPKIDVPYEHWDRAFAPSSVLSTITTASAAGDVNAASFGTCTRVSHDPVTLAFAVGLGKDTSNNVQATGEFVVNVPAFDRRQLESACVAGLDFAPGVNELEHAELTAIPSRMVAPPSIAEFGRHFECRVEWTNAWRDRLLVVGVVVAVSCTPGVIDDYGNLVWEVAKPAHYCGWPYGRSFVAAYEIMTVDLPYDGPEATAGERIVQVNA